MMFSFNQSQKLDFLDDFLLKFNENSSNLPRYSNQTITEESTPVNVVESHPDSANPSETTTFRCAKTPTFPLRHSFTVNFSTVQADS
jgi:hypothetical protein